MKAVTGYLAVLGTTGLLTATVVVLLLVGSGFAAFGGPPDADGTTSPLERIVVDEDAGGRADGTAPGRAAALQLPWSGKGVFRGGAQGVWEQLRGAGPNGGAQGDGGGAQDGGPSGGGAPGGGLGGGAQDGRPSGGGTGGGAPGGGPSGDSTGGGAPGGGLGGGAPGGGTGGGEAGGGLGGGAQDGGSWGGGTGGGAPGGDSSGVGDEGGSDGGSGGGGLPLPPPVRDPVGGLPLPPPVRDPLGGAVEGATGVLGGTLDAVTPGVAPPLTEVGSALR